MFNQVTHSPLFERTLGFLHSNASSAQRRIATLILFVRPSVCLTVTLMYFSHKLGYVKVITWIINLESLRFAIPINNCSPKGTSPIKFHLE